MKEKIDVQAMKEKIKAQMENWQPPPPRVKREGNPPTIFTRMIGDDAVFERAPTRLVHSIISKFLGWGQGYCYTKVYIADKKVFPAHVDGKYGGFILKIEGENQVFLPTVYNTKTGIEIHVAGAEEAGAICDMMIEALYNVRKEAGKLWK